MILLDANSPREIDTSELERTLNEQIKGVRDERMVVPSNFLASVVMSDAGGYHPEDERELRKYNARPLHDKRILICGEDEGCDASFIPIIPKQKTLVHQSPLFSLYHDNNPNYNELITEQIRKSKVIGSPNENDVTYLKVNGTTDYQGAGHGDIYLVKDKPIILTLRLFFDISTKKLLENRNIFWDPEGLLFSDEFLKTYLVLGGIPAQAIERARINLEGKEGMDRKVYDSIKRNFHP